MSPIHIVEAPQSAPGDGDVPAESICTSHAMRRIPVAFAWLVLGCFAATAISLYFNIPPMWSPRSPRRAERLYNAHPPLAYRLVHTGGPLHRATVWCHLLAALLGAAAIREQLRPDSQTNEQRADRLQRSSPFKKGDRYLATKQNGGKNARCSEPIPIFQRAARDPCLRLLFGLVVFHAIAWLGLVTEHYSLGSALAAIAAVFTWSAFVAGQRPTNGRHSQHFRMPHVRSLLLFGLALTPAASLTSWPVPSLATTPALALPPRRGSAFSGDYARAWAQLLGASALLAGLVIGRSRARGREQRRFGPLTLLASAGVATVLGTGVFWYRQPLPGFGEAVPGVLYYSAQPGSWSLALAQRRHRFRTIVYLHPDTSTAAHADEVDFARWRGIRLIDAASSNLTVEEFLRLTRDPSVRPILMHCIEGQNRTPAWLALYRISEQGWSLPEAYAEMERISGQRLKSYLVDWVEQGAARMKSAASAARTTPEPH